MSKTNVTVFQLRADQLGQIAGNETAPTVAPTFAATITLDTRAGIVQKINGVSTTSATCTINSAGAPLNFGQILVLVCKASASGTVTYTFGTNLLSTGTAAPTAGKTIVVCFVSDGSNFIEFARSSAAITG